MESCHTWPCLVGAGNTHPSSGFPAFQSFWNSGGFDLWLTGMKSATSGVELHMAMTSLTEDEQRCLQCLAFLFSQTQWQEIALTPDKHGAAECIAPPTPNPAEPEPKTGSWTFSKMLPNQHKHWSNHHPR
jgi:hypothetical protein